MPRRVSIAELIDSDLPLRPDEAVAVVREICRQYAAGHLRGIPNATVIRLTPEGAVVVEGPVSRDQSPVPAAAALLSELLPGFGSATGFTVPGGLRLVLARAMGVLDAPPFSGAGDFCAALERFAAPDLSEAVRGLFQSWDERQQTRGPDAPSRELTISDVRRARRATGLSLEDVSRASAIPAERLRELEWGYVRNWRPDAEARDELRRYAHAAGLDDVLVVSVAWPLIEHEHETAAESASADPAREDSGASVPAGSQALVPVSRRPVPRPPHPLRSATAFAAAVLLVAAGTWAGWQRPGVAPPIAAPAAPRRAPVIQAAPPEAAMDEVRPASFRRQGAPERPAPAGPNVRKAKPRPQPPPEPETRPAPKRKSFFERALLHIVIR